MKITAKYLVSLTVILLMYGCSMDERMFNDSFQEGVPTAVTLGYISPESTVQTRAALEPEYENRIENIYLFVFNSSGVRQELLVNPDDPSQVRGSSLFKPGEQMIPDQNNQALGKGKISFVCGSLTKATIVAIANVTVDETATAYTVTPEQLDRIQTLDELKAEIMEMNQRSVGRGALFMMTGYAEDADGNTSVDIAGTESGTALSYSLKLRRTDAKVEVKITSEDNGKTDFSFRPRTWQVVNVPAQSLILPAGETDADGDDCEYFSTTPVEMETLDHNENMTQFSGGGFVFYMPENLKSPKEQIPADGLTAEQRYAKREEWNTENLPEGGDPTRPGHTVNNIDFKYANDNSTYLVITGDVSYTNEDRKPVNATTTYYIHLGYENGDPNDYHTHRNYHYKYTVKVKGIQDIEIEVAKDGQYDDKDERPGHEGDVIVSQNGFFEFDCHYDRRLIYLYKDDLLSEDLAWGVSTPYSNGMHKISETSTPRELRDYRWIKFAVNAHYGVDPYHYVKYPGDQNYADPYPVSGMPNDKPSPYYTQDGKNYPDARLMDIDQLLTYLHKEAGKTSSNIFDNGTVAVTAFVDEFLYIWDPLEDHPTQDLLLWKTKSVNQPDRMLHIISEGAQYSPDGNSSMINSLYTFKQKSIRTIYNTDESQTGLTKAWGLEAVMEKVSGDGRLPVDEDMSVATSEQNGRLNTWNYLKDNQVWEQTGWFPWDGEYRDLQWTDVLNVYNHYELNSSRNNVFYACLLRNRDLDGDNIIDENEVRWYLASINQLTDIYIGEYALDYEARLYPYNPVEGTYPPGKSGDDIFWHYASSTYDASKRGPFIVWAEEGPSKGNYSQNDPNGSNYAYRCVRNLGIDLNEIDSTPQDFVQVSGQVIDLSWLDPKALRSYYSPGASDFVAHNEKSEHNLPRKRFEVTSWYDGDGRSWQAYQTYNPWEGAGYRLPNLRELLIFTSRMDIPTISRNPHIMSNTSFSMNGRFDYGSNRNGYSYNTSDGSMGPANNNGYVYGVKDLE